MCLGGLGPWSSWDGGEGDEVKVNYEATLHPHALFVGHGTTVPTAYFSAPVQLILHQTCGEQYFSLFPVGWLFLGSSSCGHGDQMLSWVQRGGCGGDSD